MIEMIGDRSRRQAEEVFSREAIQQVWRIYNARKGGYETVDRAAVQLVIDQFPDATPEQIDALKDYASLTTR